MKNLLAVVAGAALVAGCPPASNDDAGPPDSGALDAGAADLGRADTSPVDTGGVPCGDVTVLGACQGATLQYCDSDDNELVTFDCSTVADGVTCGLTDCDDDPDACWGYDCVTGPGGECDDDFGAEDSVFCDIEQGLGCIDGTCAESAACDPAAFTNSCAGNTLRECWSGRESTYACGNSAQCGADSHGRTYCLSKLNGGCDLTGDPPFECVAGLVCSSTTAAGRCVGVDGGTPDSATDAAVGDAAVHDAAVHDAAVHDSAVPEASAPDTAVSDRAVSEAAVFEGGGTGDH